MFYRIFPDHSRQPVTLHNHFAGPTQTACWIIGGGPSLAQLPISEIVHSPAPRFAINLAGSGLLRPTFWTSYDPTVRFHKSIYLDASILKFVHACRAMDLIPETTFKVCEAPNLVCFDRARQRGFFNFLAPSASQVQLPGDLQQASAPGVTDWQDSLIQAIDICWQLGFRRVYLAGCDMQIQPSPQLLQLGDEFRCEYQPREPLGRFLQRLRAAGCPKDQIEQSDMPGQYHFDESKSFGAAIQTDDHYYRVSQYLRLSRRAMALAGLELISVTPHSRLNDYFPFVTADQALADIHSYVGNPALESARGRYTSSDSRHPAHLIPMRDYKPHNWPETTRQQNHREVPEENIPLEQG